ncbi:hypothetical protein R3P38DRAFT_1631805 [Favolaschia claudopus]|uniref:Uncharacterized protein n=1 Tax=Favolaschia claudopus TaxID=2862362 RepID=A0AAW0DLV6_9AGAR
MLLVLHARSRTVSFPARNPYHTIIPSRISLPYPRCYRDLLSRPPLESSRFTKHLSNSNSILLIAIRLTSLPTSLSTSVHTRSYTHPRPSPSHPNSLSVAFMCPRLSGILNTSPRRFLLLLSWHRPRSFVHSRAHAMMFPSSPSTSTCRRLRSRCFTRRSGLPAPSQAYLLLQSSRRLHHSSSFLASTPHRPSASLWHYPSSFLSLHYDPSVYLLPSPSRLLNPFVCLSFFLRSYRSYCSHSYRSYTPSPFHLRPPPSMIRCLDITYSSAGVTSSSASPRPHLPTPSWPPPNLLNHCLSSRIAVVVHKVQLDKPSCGFGIAAAFEYQCYRSPLLVHSGASTRTSSPAAHPPLSHQGRCWCVSSSPASSSLGVRLQVLRRAGVPQPPKSSSIRQDMAMPPVNAAPTRIQADSLYSPFSPGLDIALHYPPPHSGLLYVHARYSTHAMLPSTHLILLSSSSVFPHLLSTRVTHLAILPRFHSAPRVRRFVMQLQSFLRSLLLRFPGTCTYPFFSLPPELPSKIVSLHPFLSLSKLLLDHHTPFSLAQRLLCRLRFCPRSSSSVLTVEVDSSTSDAVFDGRRVRASDCASWSSDARRSRAEEESLFLDADGIALASS